MKNFVPIASMILIAICLVIAGVGSYKAHDYSMQVENSEVVPERITTVEYVEIVPDLEPVGEKVQSSEKEIFCGTPIPLIRESTFVNLTYEEQDLLERVAMAEAEGEDSKGKALVMRVVLNRSLEYGMPIGEVIYSPNQFATSRMGIDPTEDCHEALAMVMDGWDESQGALYFCNSGYPKYGEPLFQHGGHYFSR